MKISNRMLYSQVNRDISRNSEILFKLSGQISSAKRINKPSDDPLGLSSVLTNRTDLNMFDQYGKSINYATGWLSRMESLVQDTDDLLARASELTIQEVSATASADTREGAAEEIKQIRSMLISNANAKYGNKYIFSGTRTHRGDRINVSEDRSVLHVALRMPKAASLVVDGVDVVAEVHEVLDRMTAFANRVRSGEWKGHAGEAHQEHRQRRHRGLRPRPGHGL